MFKIHVIERWKVNNCRKASHSKAWAINIYQLDSRYKQWANAGTISCHKNLLQGETSSTAWSCYLASLEKHSLLKCCCMSKRELGRRLQRGLSSHYAMWMFLNMQCGDVSTCGANSFVDSFDHIPIWQLKLLQVLHQLCRVQGFSPVTVSKSLWYYIYIQLVWFLQSYYWVTVIEEVADATHPSFEGLRRRRHCQVATPLPKPWQKQRPKAELPLPPRRRGRSSRQNALNRCSFFLMMIHGD